MKRITKIFIIIAFIIILVIVKYSWYANKIYTDATIKINHNPEEIIRNYTIDVRDRLAKSDSRVHVDDKSPDVLVAKKTIISKTKISDVYFDQHFQFMYSYSEEYNHSVYFLYSIGEYSVLVGVNLPNKNLNYTNIVFSGLHEINKVITKQEAISTISKCLDSYPFIENRNPTVELNSKGLFLNASTNDFDATLNLETGQCIKSEAIRAIM